MRARPASVAGFAFSHTWNINVRWTHTVGTKSQIEMTLTSLDSNSISAIAASVSAGVSALALIAVSLQVYFLMKQITQDLHWKRREKALLYSQIYHPKVQDARRNLTGKLGRLDVGNRKNRIPWKDLEATIATDKTINDDMRTVLLYLENIGLAVKYNVADFHMIYDINGTDIIRFCEIFSEYIERSRGGNPRVWQNVEGLKLRLLQERDRLRAVPISHSPI